MRTHGRGVGLMVGVAMTLAACHLPRPPVIPDRMLDVPLPELDASGPSATPAGVLPVRLLDTQARAHIGRRLLHETTGGELVQDGGWRWSSAPDRYLDSALRLAAARAGVQLKDTTGVPTVAVTLVRWQLESPTLLSGAVELTFTADDRTITSSVIRRSEPVSTPLPGNLSDAAGRLMTALATDSLQLAVHTLARP